MRARVDARFIERLSVVSLAWTVLFRLPRSGGAPWLYIEATPAAIRGAAMLSRWTGVRIDRAEYRQIDMRDGDGQLIFLRVFSGDVAAELGRVVGDASLAVLFERLGSEGRRAEVVTRGLADIDLFSAPVREQQFLAALMLVEVAAWVSARDGYARGVELWLQPRPFAGVIARCGQERGLTVRWVPPRLHWKCAALYPFGVAIASGARRLGFAVRHVRVPAAAIVSAGESRTTAAMLVPHRGAANLDQPGSHSDFFFLDGGLSTSDVIAVVEPAAPALSDADLTALERGGVRVLAVDAAVAPARTSRIRTVPPLARSTEWLTRGLPAPTAIDRRWIAREVWRYDTQVQRWREVVAATNARIYVTWYKYDAAHAAVADAMNAAGGVVAMYQRAFEGVPSPMTAVHADVMFAWSGATARIEARSGSSINHCVVTGYLGDHRIPALRAPAAALRAQLTARGVRHVIAYFDENSHDDNRWLLGHDITRTAYAALLGRVLQHDWLGLIIKPKHARTIRRRLGDGVRLLDAAIETGRCHLFDGPVVPAAAALAADVAIHGHFHAATAAVEAALAGVPTLVIDREGVPGSSLSALGHGDVIFGDWDAAWRACERVFAEGPDAVRERWRPFLADLDPFRDGRAVQRMSAYLDSLLGAFRAGASRTEALADATGRYRRKWGQDMVVAVGSPRGHVSSL